MKLLFLGDIVGRPGRTAVKNHLDEIKKEFEIDFVIANGENLAAGLGMTEETYKEMIDAGIDFFTSGNHIWAKKDFLPLLDDDKFNVIRPLNYPDGVNGRGFAVAKTPTGKIGIINLMGRVFTPGSYSSPFEETTKIITELTAKTDGIIIDFHAEATSEKVILGQYFDGKVSAVIGTHTHIQTADERVLPKGTAYITDVGMIGPLNSSLGADIETYTQGLVYQMPVKYKISKDKTIVFNGVVVDIDSKGKAQRIERLNRLYYI